jgi:hypothetical protein
MLKIPLVLALSLSVPVSFAFGANVSGSVVDSATGKSISGAMVTFGSKVTLTGSQGGFQIDGDGAAIHARAYGYTRTQVGADDHGAKSIQLKLTPFTPHAVYLSFWGRDNSRRLHNKSTLLCRERSLVESLRAPKTSNPGRPFESEGARTSSMTSLRIACLGRFSV